MDIAVQAVMGIATGIVTSVLILLTKHFYTDTVSPRLAEIRYRGVDIAGEWGELSFDHMATSLISLSLKQSAHELSGQALLRFSGPGNDFALHFVVSGYLWEGYVTLNLRPEDRKVTSYATALFKIAGGGDSLQGMMVFRNVNTERVDQHPATLRRHDRQRILEAFVLAQAERLAGRTPPPEAANEIEAKLLDNNEPKT